MNDFKSEMKNLIKKLNSATFEYDKGSPIMTDEEWDNLYFQLVALEIENDFRFPESPTQSISYQVVNQLEKVEHNHKMLSLDKTKDWEEFTNYFGSKVVCEMLKMDGLTCSLRYMNGKLVSAETRGNGFVGEDILHNAQVIQSIPKTIKYKGEFIVDGEVICTYKNFEPFAKEYKNPRNFASGSIRLLDAKECKKRNLTFVLWKVIKGFEEENSFMAKLEKARDLNFVIVPYTSSLNEESKEYLTSLAKEFGYPIDGLVCRFDDIKYGESLGETSHHFKDALAFKFYDEIFPSKILNIEWTMGRTGVLTPVAIFDPVEIDGSTVERASMHNVTIMKELLGENPHVGQKVQIFKSNMIIPQIYSAEKESHGETIEIPTVCPICGSPIIERADNNSVFLVCTNSSCEGKLINKLDHFCGKKGLDIKGLSKMTMEKLLNWGWLSNILDLYELQKHSAEWIKKPGFGEKSVTKILDAIEASKNCSLNSFICALGIPLIGVSASKELCKYFNSWEEFRNAIKSNYKFFNIEGFGLEMHNAIINFDYTIADELVNKYLIIQKEEVKKETSNSLEGVVVVITGKLTQYKNRSSLQADIENHGGKVTGSVSRNTTYLINNDNTSSSSKNVAAKKLNIPILTEAEFIERFLTK